MLSVRVRSPERIVDVGLDSWEVTGQFDDDAAVPGQLAGRGFHRGILLQLSNSLGVSFRLFRFPRLLARSRPRPFFRLVR